MLVLFINPSISTYNLKNPFILLILNCTIRVLEQLDVHMLQKKKTTPDTDHTSFTKINSKMNHGPKCKMQNDTTSRLKHTRKSM